jgi:hypothetical protein
VTFSTWLRLWFGLDIFTTSDIAAIEPLPGTRVLITQPRKAGSREPDYAFAYMSRTTWRQPGRWGWTTKVHLTWWGRDSPIFREVEGNYRFGGGETHNRSGFKISTIRTLQSSHHVSSGYQPCTIRLTSPRRLIPTCELKNTSKNMVDANSNCKSKGLSTWWWGSTNWSILHGETVLNID